MPGLHAESLSSAALSRSALWPRLRRCPAPPSQDRARQHGEPWLLEPQQAALLSRMGGGQGAKGARRRWRSRPPQGARGLVGVLIALPSPEAGFSEGGALASSRIYAVRMQPRLLVQRCKRLSPLLAAPAALLLSQGQAKAVLTYNIFESGGNVVVQISGSLDLTGAT